MLPSYFKQILVIVMTMMWSSLPSTNYSPAHSFLDSLLSSSATSNLLNLINQPLLPIQVLATTKSSINFIVLIMQVFVKPAFGLSLVFGLLAVATMALPLVGCHRISSSPNTSDHLSPRMKPDSRKTSPTSMTS